jgi:hypothetical protein
MIKSMIIKVSLIIRMLEYGGVYNNTYLFNLL